MKKRNHSIILLIFIMLLLFSFSCKKELKNKILLSSEGVFLIVDEHGKIIKKIKTELDGKCIISEINEDNVIFNYYSKDNKSSDIYILNLKNGEYKSITKGLYGYFSYPPKFYDSSNIIFTLRTINEGLDYLYIYNIENDSIKKLFLDFKTNLIFPIYIDETNSNLYLLSSKLDNERLTILLYNVEKNNYIDLFKDLKGKISNPIFSSKGDYIVFNYLEENQNFVYLMELKSFTIINITENYKGDISLSGISKEGDKIFFIKRLDINNSNSKLFMFNRVALKITEIYDFGLKEFYYINCYKDLIYIMLREDFLTYYNLYIMNKNSKKLQKINLNENFGFIGKLYLSENYNKIITCYFDSKNNKEIYFISDLNGENRININKLLNKDIDSVCFYENN